MTYGLDTSVVLRLLTNQPLKLATNAIVKVHLDAPPFLL